MCYQLIAFDMDGTLLDSNKKILPSSLAAISDAADAGKTVILSTGRCLPELREYLPLLTQVRYLNCVSGALVVDRQTNTAIYSCSFNDLPPNSGFCGASGYYGASARRDHFHHPAQPLPKHDALRHGTISGII